MRLNDKQKMTVVLLVMGLALIGLGTLTFFKYRERSERLTEMDGYVKREKAANQKIQRIPELRKDRDRLASTIKEYADILPKEAHVEHDAFVDTIDNYRQDTNIVIKRAEYVKPTAARGKKNAAPTSPTKFIRHKYKFELVGTIQDFISFINKIENHTRFLKVDAFNIRPLGAPATAPRFDGVSSDRELANADNPIKEIDLTISTYTYKQL